ncbi:MULTISPECIES: hypothetical protein [unclassified Microcoleus]|uniref:hypothetical protein n=1 Tax=unclassified Microcoleus TaxID=2642155 RepID=UPI002FD07AE2
MKKVNYLGIEVESSVITSEEYSSLPLAADGELDLAASLAMQELYKVFRDRGGRELDNCAGWAAVAGYRIPELKRAEFTLLCKQKWRSLVQYLETDYRLR